MGIGVDIIEIKRIEEMVAHWGDSFLNRIFTDRELGEWKSRGERMAFLAGRFATKEAFLKASGVKGVGWKEIEVLGIPMEKPVIWVRGKKEEDADVSISHTNELAISIVITM
ncbi:MAG: holo-ACP synthase [bacterium]|nr:holo-ACP synthase [bacterium]